MSNEMERKSLLSRSNNLMLVGLIVIVMGVYLISLGHSNMPIWLVSVGYFSTFSGVVIVAKTIIISWRLVLAGLPHRFEE